ncbi:MAG: DoxX family membrane protein [Saprospiraceae bacterium]|nr:DoxX family membrane protein [Saprospiraceae bacterium]
MKDKILTGLYIVFGLLFINSGINKFLNYMPMPENISTEPVNLMTSFKDIKWLMPLVAVAEIIGGALLIFKKYRALGAIILFPITIGVLLVHIVQDSSGLIMGLIVFGLNLWIIYENRAKYMPMIQD